MFRAALFLLTIVLTGAPAIARSADRNFIVVQSTTSTQNSGLFDFILPRFRATSGMDVRVVAVGTGQALKNGRNGDGDVVLVHARAAEDHFIAGGFGIERRDVMYNDFVVIGPPSDPAGIRGMKDAAAALVRISQARALWVSRGDNSGTHIKERSLWRASGVDPSGASGKWYREAGSGMGAHALSRLGSCQAVG